MTSSSIKLHSQRATRLFPLIRTSRAFSFIVLVSDKKEHKAPQPLKDLCPTPVERGQEFQFMMAKHHNIKQEFQFMMAKHHNIKQEQDSGYLHDSLRQNQTTQTSGRALNPTPTQLSSVSKRSLPDRSEQEGLKKRRVNEELDNSSIRRRRNIPDASGQFNYHQQMALKSKRFETSFESKTISLTYEFQGKKKEVPADPNETIFDVLKRNDGEIIDETKFLYVSVKESCAVINPWVPCEALKNLGTLDITVKNIKPPEPSEYSTSDLQCFTVNALKKNRQGTFRAVIRDKQYSENKPLLVFGHKDESIKEALQRDTRFHVTPELELQTGKAPLYLSIYSENLSAELYSSVPCGALAGDVKLTVTLRKGKSPESYKYPVYSDGMFFKLDKRSNLKSKLHEKHCYHDRPLAVYGSVEQSIQEAFTNDKRFNITGKFFLQHSGEPDRSSDLSLSQLKQENFYVIFQNKSHKPTNKRSNVQETEAVNDERLNIPNHSQTRSEKRRVYYVKRALPHSHPTSSKFSNEFNNLPDRVRSHVLNMNLRDYIENVLRKIPVTAKLHNTLNRHKQNVAIIGCKSQYDHKYTWGGTIFLLTKHVALTCHHVIKGLKDSFNTDRFDIFFNYDIEPFSDRQNSAQVETLLSSEVHDFTFLKVIYCYGSIEKSPLGLFPYVAHPPSRGAVSIIGHPGGECKKVDAMCSVIEYKYREAAIANAILSNPAHLHLFTRSSYMEMTDRDHVTYDTCMYHGASGSPVFNDKGMLVAMHIGGYVINNGRKKKSMLEYGRNINDIILYGTRHDETIRKALNDFKAIFPNNCPK
ncbi:uncharacterized protein [Engystomops pustulosus]|uniref:uncharacterized protein isoform X2 n=1 Tax=Engystomops pustulosus TaxID=76066 RepID=UPI003AFB5CEB